MDIDYSEVFGLEPETGEEAQEVTAPAEQGAEEQESAAPAVEEVAQPPEDQAAEGGKTEDDARYAAARRKAEAERDAEIERIRRESQEETRRAIDEAIRSSGMTNPYTGQPITSKEELDAYQRQHQARQAQALQKKAGLTPEEYQALVNSLPEVRQEREARVKAEAAARQVREREDLGGGAQQHRVAPGQLLPQGPQEGGLAAAADDGGDAGPDVQQLSERHGSTSLSFFFS